MGDWSTNNGTNLQPFDFFYYTPLQGKNDLASHECASLSLITVLNKAFLASCKFETIILYYMIFTEKRKIIVRIQGH